MNIGRCWRAFSARSTAPRPMIGSELAVHETTMSNSARRAGRSARRIASAPKRPASFSPRSQRAVGDRHRARLRAPRNGWPRARSSRRRRRTARVISRRSSNSCDASRTDGGGHADRVRADLGRACALPWRPRTSAGTSGAACVPSVPALVGLAHRLLHLAEDLRLAEHHRIEPAGDAERVPRGGAAFAARRRASRSVLAAARRRRRPASRWPGATSARGSAPHVELGAVAGRDDRDLARPGRGGERETPAAAAASCCEREREAAAQIERRGRVVQSEGEDAHRPIIKFAPLRRLQPCERASGARPWIRSTPSGISLNFFAPAVGVGCARRRRWPSCSGGASSPASRWRGSAAWARAAMRGGAVAGLVDLRARRQDGDLRGDGASPAPLALWWAGFRHARAEAASAATPALSAATTSPRSECAQRLGDRTSIIWPTRRAGAGEVDDAVALGAAHQLAGVLARRRLRPGCAAPCRRGSR